MADDELDRIRERIEQNRLTENGSRATLADNPHAAACRMGCTFFAGDRVLDLVSGLDGVVETVTRENVVKSAPRATAVPAGGSLAGLPNSEILELVSLRLNTGQVVIRRVRELVKRPTLPGGK